MAKNLVNGANIIVEEDGDNINLEFSSSALNKIAPVGSVSLYAGSTAPSGWLICNGSAISRTTYSDLFSVIGTSYGGGDGSTTFNLPDLQGRVPVGYKSSDTSFDTIGETGGSKTNTHNHGKGTNITTSAGTAGSYVIGDGNDVASTEISILQPYIVMNYIISY